MSEPDLQWYILSIKPKQEQAVIKNLDILGVQHYLPLYQRKKKIKKTKTDVVVPLFPGYLFCRFEFDEHYQKIRYTRGIKKVLGSKQSLWVIDDEKIEDIRNREKDGLVVLKKVEEKFEKGGRIIVDEGDFDGWEGIFMEDIPDEKRAVILLTNVNFTTKLTLPKEYLKSY
ncbi:MAG: transcription termination/antitermination NusG family protein [Acidobacteriota bacterium]